MIWLWSRCFARETTPCCRPRQNLLYTYVLFPRPKNRPEASPLQGFSTAGIGASWPLSASSRFPAAGAIPAFFGHRCGSYVDTKLWRGVALLWSSATISARDNWLLVAALPYYVYSTTGSTLAAGV